MFLATVCLWVLVLATHSTFCNGLTIRPGNGLSTRTPAPLTNVSWPLGRPSTTPILKDVRIQCRGRSFGMDLRYHSCLDAFATFPFGGSDVPMKIERRGTGTLVHHLPWKWVSGDGLCVFDIFMNGPGPFETSTGREIARAAWKLMNECVRDQGGQGGVVGNLGERKSLGIIMRSFDPRNIECGTTIQRYGDDKCQSLMRAIPADVAPTIKWGPSGQPKPDKVLPYAYELPSITPGHGCTLRVWGAGGNNELRDTMSYYELWNAGVMLAGMCSRYGQPGKFEKLGQNQRLWVLLDGVSNWNPQDMAAAAGNQTLPTVGGSVDADQDGSRATT